jgi:hypothetical protein
MPSIGSFVRPFVRWFAGGSGVSGRVERPVFQARIEASARAGSPLFSRELERPAVHPTKVAV